MRRYVFKRLLIAVPSLLIASLIVFTLPRLLPGDAVQLMLAEKAYAKDVDELRAKLGLDRPIAVQYVEWLGRVARGDLGESLWTRRPVLQELGQRLPITLELAFFALAFALLIALPVGVISAARADTLLTPRRGRPFGPGRCREGGWRCPPARPRRTRARTRGSPPAGPCARSAPP